MLYSTHIHYIDYSPWETICNLLELKLLNLVNKIK